MIKLIYGQEEYLNHLHINQIIKKNNLQKENIFSFSIKNHSLFEILDKTKNDNLFSEKQLFLIKDIDIAFNKKGYEKDLMYLKRHLFFDKNNVVIITTNSEELKDQFEIIKSLEKEKNVIKNKKLSKRELMALMKKAFKNRQLQFDSDEFLNNILEKTDSNLRSIINEIDKLALIKNNFKEGNLDHFVFESAKVNVFKLTNAIIEQKYDNIMKSYQKIVKKGINPLAILALLSLNFGIIYSVFLGKKNNLNSKEIAAKLKKPFFVIGRYSKILNHFQISEIEKIINKLANLELKFKKGLINNPDFIEFFLISLIK